MCTSSLLKFIPCLSLWCWGDCNSDTGFIYFISLSFTLHLIIFCVGDGAGMTCIGFLGGATGKEPICQCRRCKRLGFNHWVRKIPWWRTWQPTPVFLPGEFHRQRSLAGYSPHGHKVRHDCATNTMLNTNTIKERNNYRIISIITATRSLYSRTKKDTNFM